MKLATRQHGVVTTRQLSEIGYTRSSVSKAAKVGRLHRLHRGVYAVGHRKLTWESHCHAAVLACAPAVASHRSAGWLWGILRWRPTTFDLTAQTRRHAKRNLRVHFATLGSLDLAELDGIPVTALPRTYLDLAGSLSTGSLEGALERGEERGLLDLDPIEVLLARAGGHPGAGKLRRALGIYRPKLSFTRSGVEERFLDLVRQAGLPTPASNYNVAGFELDVYWERERFAVELDVYETHGSRAAFERDRIRQEDLKLIGIEMTRVTGARLEREPRNVMNRVAALLEQRR